MEDPLATLEDLRLFLDDPDLDSERGTLLLRLASGEVRAHCGQVFTPTEDEEVLLDGTGTKVLLLDELPVISVSKVEEGVEGDLAELPGPLASSPAWEWSEDGILHRIDGSRWARRFRFYRVTYSHGWSSIPDEVSAIVLRVAARAFSNPEEMRQEMIGRYSYTKGGGEAGVGLYPADRVALAPYFVGTSRRPSTAQGSGS